VDIIWIAVLPFVGLVCVLIGFVFVLGAVEAGLSRGGAGMVARRLQVGLACLIASSACNVLFVIDAWTNRNDKVLISTVVGYAAFAVPVAVGLFSIGTFLRLHGQAHSAIQWFTAAVVAWASVGWAQTTQMYLLILFAIYFR
jgi:hypothetical protein